MRKLIIISFLFIFLLLCISSVSSFQDPLTGEECSTTPSDYQYYNDSGDTRSTALTIDFDDIINITNTEIVTFHMIEFTRDSTTAHQNLGVYDDSGSIITLFQWMSAGGNCSSINWCLWDNAAYYGTDIVSLANARYNISSTMEFANRVHNTTISNNSDIIYFNDLGWRFDVDIGGFRIAFEEVKNATWTGMYLWNGTECPSVAPPPTAAVAFEGIEISLPSRKVPIFSQVNFHDSLKITLPFGRRLIR